MAGSLIEEEVWVKNSKSKKIDVLVVLDMDDVNDDLELIKSRKVVKITYDGTKEKYFLSPEEFLRKFVLGNIKEVKV